MAKNLKFSPKAIGFIFTFVSLIVIVMGVCLNINNKKLKERCTDTVTASVVENIIENTRKEIENSYYRPVFDFTYNGNHYRVKSNTSQKPALFELGEKTELKVNPSDPNEFYVPADKKQDNSGTICIAVGAVFLIIGVIAVIKR